MRRDNRKGVKALAEQLRSLANTGAVLRIDNDSFSIITRAELDLPEENPDALEGDPDHYRSIEDEAERLSPAKIPDGDMPDDLIAALGLLLGFRAEGV